MPRNLQIFRTHQGEGKWAVLFVTLSTGLNFLLLLILSMFEFGGVRAHAKAVSVRHDLVEELERKEPVTQRATVDVDKVASRQRGRGIPDYSDVQGEMEVMEIAEPGLDGMEMDLSAVMTIGMTDASDQRLLGWAQSYAQPPTIKVHGGRLEAYLPGRRAHRLAVAGSSLTIEIEPRVACIHPVFELVGTPKELLQVKLNDGQLKVGQYAWDGQTLWLNTEIVKPTTLHLSFSGM